MPSFDALIVCGSVPSTESYFRRWAIVSSDPRSLTATKSMSAPRSVAARNRLRPMRPKPLMPTRTVMRGGSFHRRTVPPTLAATPIPHSEPLGRARRELSSGESSSGRPLAVDGHELRGPSPGPAGPPRRSGRRASRSAPHARSRAWSRRWPRSPPCHHECPGSTARRTSGHARSRWISSPDGSTSGCWRFGRRGGRPARSARRSRAPARSGTGRGRAAVFSSQVFIRRDAGPSGAPDRARGTPRRRRA